MNIFQPIIIFSVYKNNKNEFANLDNHKKTIDLLNKNNISFKEIEGSYNGYKEKSLLVLDNIDNLILVNELVKKFNQESILLVDSNRHGILKFINKNTPLGKMNSSKNMPNLNAYSYDNQNKIFYFFE